MNEKRKEKEKEKGPRANRYEIVLVLLRYVPAEIFMIYMLCMFYIDIGLGSLLFLYCFKIHFVMFSNDLGMVLYAANVGSIF